MCGLCTSLCVVCELQLLVRLRESSRQTPCHSRDVTSRSANSVHNSSLTDDDMDFDIGAVGIESTSGIEMTLSDAIVNIEFTSMDFRRESVDVCRCSSVDSLQADRLAAAATDAAADNNSPSAVSTCHLSQSVGSSPVLLPHYKVTTY